MISSDRVFYFDYRTNELCKYLINELQRTLSKTDEILETTVPGPNVTNKTRSILRCAR